MKGRIHRRNKRKAFYRTHKFAAIIIGLLSGMVIAEFMCICLFPAKEYLMIGSLFGYMMYNFYLGIMIDLERERLARATYKVERRMKQNGTGVNHYQGRRKEA